MKKLWSKWQLALDALLYCSLLSNHIFCNHQLYTNTAIPVEIIGWIKLAPSQSSSVSSINFNLNPNTISRKFLVEDKNALAALPISCPVAFTPTPPTGVADGDRIDRGIWDIPGPNSVPPAWSLSDAEMATGPKTPNAPASLHP